MPANRSVGSRLIIGLLLVLVGVYLLLNNFDLIPFTLPHYVFSWQTLLILIGLVIVGTREHKGGGITLIIIGVIFLLPEIFYVSFDDILMFWPLVFVIIGISILLRRNREKKKIDYPESPGFDTDYIDDTAIFGSSHKIITSDYFKGGHITAILGSARVDLTHAELAEGKYEIDVFSLFGSIEVIIPNNWHVKNQVDTVLGTFTDKRAYHVHYNPQATRQLLIKGIAILGSGEVKSP